MYQDCRRSVETRDCYDDRMIRRQRYLEIFFSFQHLDDRGVNHPSPFVAFFANKVHRTCNESYCAPNETKETETLRESETLVKTRRKKVKETLYVHVISLKEDSFNEGAIRTASSSKIVDDAGVSMPNVSCWRDFNINRASFDASIFVRNGLPSFAVSIVAGLTDSLGGCKVFERQRFRCVLAICSKGKTTSTCTRRIRESVPLCSSTSMHSAMDCQFGQDSRRTNFYCICVNHCVRIIFVIIICLYYLLYLLLKSCRHYIITNNY